jgi:hypothetical protein
VFRSSLFTHQEVFIHSRGLGGAAYCVQPYMYRADLNVGEPKSLIKELTMFVCPLRAAHVSGCITGGR